MAGSWAKENLMVIASLSVYCKKRCRIFAADFVQINEFNICEQDGSFIKQHGAITNTRYVGRGGLGGGWVGVVKRIYTN
jgi:hypothetical protein